MSSSGNSETWYTTEGIYSFSHITCKDEKWPSTGINSFADSAILIVTSCIDTTSLQTLTSEGQLEMMSSAISPVELPLAMFVILDYAILVIWESSHSRIPWSMINTFAWRVSSKHLPLGCETISTGESNSSSVKYPSIWVKTMTGAIVWMNYSFWFFGKQHFHNSDEVVGNTLV